jgi:hypothetical protein
MSIPVDQDAPIGLQPRLSRRKKTLRTASPKGRTVDDVRKRGHSDALVSRIHRNLGVDGDVSSALNSSAGASTRGRSPLRSRSAQRLVAPCDLSDQKAKMLALWTSKEGDEWKKVR